MRITWKREERQRGLAAICQGERGFDLRIDGKRVACVRPLYEGLGRKFAGYYWYTSDAKAIGIRHHNTAFSPVPTIEDAKNQCKDYVLSQIAASE